MRIADCGLRINRIRISVYIPDLQFEIRNAQSAIPFTSSTASFSLRETGRY